MEENKGLEMGVEETGAADLEPGEASSEQEITETGEQTQEATQETEPKEMTAESKFEKAFAKRLSKAQEKIEKEVESKYEEKLSRFQKVLEIGARENGMPFDEYVDALLGEYGDEYSDYSDSPLDPESMQIIEELKEQKAASEMEAEKKAYWNRQAKQLQDVGVTDLSQIPEEVIERALENDTEIAFEYLKWDKQQAIEKAKKDTIREIQEQNSPGSLSGGGYEGGNGISELKWSDPKFEELKQRVYRGEKIRF